MRHHNKISRKDVVPSGIMYSCSMHVSQQRKPETMVISSDTLQDIHPISKLQSSNFV